MPTDSRAVTPSQRLGVRVAEENRAADSRAKRGCDECIERVD